MIPPQRTISSSYFNPSSSNRTKVKTVCIVASKKIGKENLAKCFSSMWPPKWPQEICSYCVGTASSQPGPRVNSKACQQLLGGTRKKLFCYSQLHDHTQALTRNNSKSLPNMSQHSHSAMSSRNLMLAFVEHSLQKASHRAWHSSQPAEEIDIIPPN